MAKIAALKEKENVLDDLILCSLITGSFIFPFFHAHLDNVGAHGTEWN
jgi:hypothetical protein